MSKSLGAEPWPWQKIRRTLDSPTDAELVALIPLLYPRAEGSVTKSDVQEGLKQIAFLLDRALPDKTPSPANGLPRSSPCRVCGDRTCMTFIVRQRGRLLGSVEHTGRPLFGWWHAQSAGVVLASKASTCGVSDLFGVGGRQLLL
jgi:hypothetical protein